MVCPWKIADLSMMKAQFFGLKAPSILLNQKKMKKILVVWSLVIQALIINTAFAQKPEVAISNKPGWHKIGEVTASFNDQSESISVLGADKFKAIKLKVTDAPINIESASIFYESGESEEIPVSHEMAKGTETRAFDLKSPAAGIKKVTFNYKTTANDRDKKAHVELYGLK
jgi:hypothetical protein